MSILSWLTQYDHTQPFRAFPGEAHSGLPEGVACDQVEYLVSCMHSAISGLVQSHCLQNMGPEGMRSWRGEGENETA